MSLFEGVELTPEQQAAVQANADKQYLGYESPDQVKGLKANNDALLAEKHEAGRVAKEASDAAESARLDTARSKGDVKALEESWAAKQAESDDRYNALLKQNESSAISAEVNKLAAELGGDNAALLAPHIQNRLRYEDGQVKVMDSNGGLTISTLDDLAKEFRNNPMFASAIVGTKANGGGAAHGGKSNSSGASLGNKKWSEMTMIEKTQHLENKGA